MFDNKYPYTDFSQLNLDWFLLKFKELLEEQERVSGKVKDLDDTVKEFTDFVTNYFDNLDVQAEVNVKLNEMAADGTLSDLLAPLVAADIGDVVAAQIGDVVDNQIDDVVADQIGAVVADQIDTAVAPEVPGAVTSWLNDNVDPVGSAVVVDSSLSITGAAADAKVTGDKISDLNTFDDNISDILEIDAYPKDTKSVSTSSVKILEGLEFVAGHTYTVTCTIPSAIAGNVYCYWKKSNDTTVTSDAISAGNTTWTYTLAITDDFTGYISALTSSGTVNVTAEVVSDIPLSNAIERIDLEISSLDKIVEVDGYSMIPFVIDTGAGAYYKQSGKAYKNTSGFYGTDYTYFIFNVKSNSYYSFSYVPRWIVLENSDETVYSDIPTGKYIYTGTAVKLYYTISNSYVSDLAISKGFWANKAQKNKLNISPAVDEHRGNGLPIDIMYFTVGFTEKLYYRNMMSIPTDEISLIMSCNGQDTHDDTGVTITPVSALSNINNAVRAIEFDELFNKVYVPNYSGLVIKEKNLQNCSAIVIGDSTVGSWGTMTQHMLDVFTENGKTLTLMGTRGEGLNKHEGRGGWSAKAYCTEASHGDYTNPFLNNGHFDFSYYMTEQGYTKPDFVIIQLGINDVSNIDISEFDSVAEQALIYEQEMIDSILDYDDSIKVLINPPTCPNSNRQYLSEYYETTVFRNMIIRYAMMLRRMITRYNNSKVRASNMNLLLDTITEIRDNVHPTTEGFNKMGDEVVSQFNCWLN